jgi:hypothetical protein
VHLDASKPKVLGWRTQVFFEQGIRNAGCYLQAHLEVRQGQATDCTVTATDRDEAPNFRLFVRTASWFRRWRGVELDNRGAPAWSHRLGTGVAT